MATASFRLNGIVGKCAVLIVVAAFFSVVSVFESPSNVAACAADRWECNSDEDRARNACWPADGQEGSIWFNNSGGAADRAGYYSNTVTIAYNATSVPVNIRGSVNACQVGASGGNWAVNVGASSPNAGRLTGLGSTTLYRGHLQGAPYLWTTRGGEIGAWLDVSGIATNNGSGQDVGQLQVGVYRCYSNNGSTQTGGCGVSLVTVNVIRQQKPIDWTLTPSVSTGSATAKPGDTITWTHSVRNNGPDATNQAASFYYNNSNAFTGTGGNTPFANGTGAGTTRTFNSTYTVQPGDVDKQFCRATSVIPRSATNSAVLTSSTACVTIVNQWTIIPTSTVFSISGTASTTIAKPGDTVTWKHDVRNNGPNATRSNVTYRYENSTGLPAGSGPAQTLPINTVNGGTGTVNSTYLVQPGDVNKTLCRTTSAVPRAWNNAALLASAPDCVTVPYNYVLNPTLSLDRSGVIEAPTSVNITPKVSNAGPTNSRATQWQLTRIDVVSGRTISNPSGGQSPVGTLPCSFFSGPGASCSVIQSGNSVFNTDGTITGSLLNAMMQSIVELPVGSKICFALSVQPFSSSSTNWSHSAPACLTVGKKPKVQVWGGDLVVGKGVASPGSMTATSTSSPTQMYGSWGEYGVLSSGPVKEMASASGYAGGITPTNLCSVSLLTVTNQDGANPCAVGKIGNYAMASTQPQVATRFPVTATTPKISNRINVETLVSGQTYTSNGTTPIILEDGTPATPTMPVGKWVVINAPYANVVITKNITYTAGPIASAAEIPQLIIIANNIIIADSVTQVDAWLVATGTGLEGRLNTCGASIDGAGNVNGAITESTALTSGLCANQLRVNGPTIVNHLLLRRTAGSGVGPDRGTPGEIFNLRPDAYLWATNYVAGQGRVPTVSNQELPPRY